MDTLPLRTDDRAVEGVAPARPERRDAAEHRRRILAAAHKLFALHGVAAVSMSQIAKNALVGQGTLYRRYHNKGELCMDMLRERHDGFIHDMTERQRALAASPALNRLDDALAQSVAFLEQHCSLLGPGAPMPACPLPLGVDSQASHQHPLFYAWLQNLLTSLLTEAVERGELAPLDVPYTVDAILACLHPQLYQFQRQERGFTPARISAGLRRIYLTGVRGDGG